jgi:hypothetical protein
MYKLIKDSLIFGKSNTVIRISDGASIPFDLSNTAYAEYLAWLAEGNVPEEA